ncbi:MAG: efflux RND transporter periplasmic adaptor subunit [Alphaproteobacteria bacterium]|nr:efflux RND transporter periplasmic adaptor subunit [Alphaproteobacteria bacterium]
MKRFRIPIIPVILLVIVLAVVIAIASRDKPDENAEPAAALTVSLVKAQGIDWPETIEASGAIEPWQEAIIGAEVGGLRLSDVLVDVGEKVKKGQVLARFDEATTRANIAQQRASVAQAQAALAEAEANAKRAETLRDTGALSEQEILNFTTQATTARAQLEAARAQLDVSDLQLTYTRVVAPDDGVISARTATVGSVAAVGTELFRMVRQSRLEWRAELTGTQLTRVQPGYEAKFTLPDGTEGKGKVRQLAPVLNDRTRTAIAYVDIDKDAKSARAGMFVTGRIETGSTKGVAVPQGAVVRRDGYEYIFKVTAEGKVEQHKVATGRREGDLLEIREGLATGDAIVGKGAGFLNDGDKVDVVEEEAQK